MSTDDIPGIRSALAALKPAALRRVSAALVVGKENPMIAVEALREAAREILPTNRDAAETFLGIAEIMAAELDKRQP